MKRALLYKFMILAIFLVIVIFTGTGRCLEGTEYQIKGAMILNFIKFVEWPHQENEQNRDIIIVGIFGQDNFGNMLANIEGRFISSKQIKIKRLNSLNGISECQVLFISASESFRTYQILQEINGYPVLTIGEDKDFTRLGGIIRFYSEENHIRFEINHTAAIKSDLKISAKLLEIARVIQ
ncbi:MAG: YfiR family protein [Dissulfuribacterales bacterium]